MNFRIRGLEAAFNAVNAVHNQLRRSGVLQDFPNNPHSDCIGRNELGSVTCV
jgi:hypothetical protein